MLRGNSPATVDQKGRLKIPAQFLAELAEMGTEFYVTNDQGDHVWIYPLAQWNAIEEKLARIPASNPAKQRFLTRTNYFGQTVTMDKQGRVLIPALLREAAEMKGEVVVLGYQNHLRVWNHQRLQERLKGSPVTDDDQQILADLGI
jgi:MraZ protein